MGCRTLVVFKGAGFLTRHSLLPPADSDPSFLCARGAREEKPAPFTKTVKGAAPQSGWWTSLLEGKFSEQWHPLR
jgi:hypothetical protein